MAGFGFDPNFDFDAMNANFGMDPNIPSEELPSTNQGTTSQSEGSAGDASVGIPSHDSDPSVSQGALMTNANFSPFLPITDDNSPFVASGAPTTDGPDPEHGQALYQQSFQESVGSNEPHLPDTNQTATNAFNVDEDDWLRFTNEEEDEAFNKLMEMSSEEFEKIMRALPDEENTAPGPSSTTSYATSSKRVRCNEEDSAPASVGGAPSAPQPQQIHQIRQIREVKSRQGKAIEGLENKVRDLEADLAKAHSEAKDAFENGRMVALLGAEGDWEAKEAKLKHDAELEHERQIGVVRNFLEGQIAEKAKQLDQYRAEAGEYKKSVEGEAEGYKKAAEEEIGAQRAALKAAEGAKDRAESSLSEQRRVLESAKPYVAGLEKKIADLEGEKANWEAADSLREQTPQPPAMGALEVRIEELEAAAEKTKATLGESEEAVKNLNGANERAETARADLERLFQNSQSYARELEIKLANLEKEQSSKEAARLQREEERKALEDRVKDLESLAEKAKRAKKETQSVVGPVEQVNVEPSTPANAKALSASSFTFVATREFPPSQVGVEPVHGKRSQRQSRLQRQSQSQPQHQSQPQLNQGPEPEPEPTPPSQWGMFSRHCHPPVPADRPRRVHIHAEEAIRNRFQIPLEKVHSITSKLDKRDKAQDGAGAAEKAELIIAAELTGLSVRDLKVMRSLRMGFPGASAKPRSVMTSAQLEIPMTLVELLASENRPAIRAFLDGASFQPSQASSDIARDTRSQGTQTEALEAEVEGIEEDKGIQEEAAVVPPTKQSRWGSRLGVASPWKTLIFLCLLGLILPLLLPLPWSSPVAWFFEDPDPRSGWLNYEPPPSPWSRFIPDFSGWPVISKLFSSFFDDEDLESKWCGNIPMG